MPDSSTQLASILGAEHINLDQLLAKEADDLLAAIERAQAMQDAELRAGLEQVVSHLPRVIRGPARKIVFG